MQGRKGSERRRAPAARGPHASHGGMGPRRIPRPHTACLQACASGPSPSRPSRARIHPHAASRTTAQHRGCTGGGRCGAARRGGRRIGGGRMGAGAGVPMREQRKTTRTTEAASDWVHAPQVPLTSSVTNGVARFCRGGRRIAGHGSAGVRPIPPLGRPWPVSASPDSAAARGTGYGAVRPHSAAVTPRSEFCREKGRRGVTLSMACGWRNGRERGRWARGPAFCRGRRENGVESAQGRWRGDGWNGAERRARHFSPPPAAAGSATHRGAEEGPRPPGPTGAGSPSPGHPPPRTRLPHSRHLRRSTFLARSRVRVRRRALVIFFVGRLRRCWYRWREGSPRVAGFVARSSLRPPGCTRSRARACVRA